MYIDELQLFVHKRLNISKSFENKNITKIEYLKSIDDKDLSIDRNFIIISSRLYDDVKKYVSAFYIKNSKTIINNRIDQALFFVSLIFNNLYFNENDEIDFSLTFKKGVILSKDMIINFIPIKVYYELKKILIENNIVSEVEFNLNDKTIYYSKTLKISKKYILNETYKYKIKIKKVKNKCISKFFLFKRNGVLFGNKQKSLKYDFLPFDNDQKNIQYVYHKYMYFDDSSFFDELKLNIPNYKKYINDKKSKDGKFVRKMLSFYRSLNLNIFSSSEAYGRIYLPFHYIPSEYRKCIRIGNDEKLFEVFDIKCCFVFLSAKIIKNNTIDNKLKEECDKIISLTQNDIYKEILKYNNIICNNEKRKKLKSAVMKWLFSNLQERRVVISSSMDLQYIEAYFKNVFPLFYHEIVFYKTRTIYSMNDENIIVKTKKSDLPFSCFEYESYIMFNIILPKLNAMYDNIPFISLHDAIYIPERFYKDRNRLKSTILSLINDIE